MLTYLYSHQTLEYTLPTVPQPLDAELYIQNPGPRTPHSPKSPYLMTAPPSAALTAGTQTPVQPVVSSGPLWHEAGWAGVTARVAT